MTNPTSRESAASHRLAEALIEFIVALDEGCAARRVSREQAAEARRGEKSHIHAAPASGEREVRPLLMSAREAAEYIGVGGRTLWSMTAPKGPFPCVHIGRRVLYRVSDLETAVEQMRVKPRKG